MTRSALTRSSLAALGILLASGGFAARAQTASELITSGKQALEASRPDDAVRSFERAVRLEPGVAGHRVQLAQALGAVAARASVFRQPFLARRIKSELDRAVELDPLSVDARVGLMQYYLQAPAIAGGGEDKARAMAVEIARLNPLRGHFAQAQIAHRNRDTSSAEREYRAAVVTAPDSAVAYTQLAMFLHNRRRTAEARDVLAQLLVRTPDDPAALRALRRINNPGASDRD